MSTEPNEPPDDRTDRAPERTEHTERDASGEPRRPRRPRPPEPQSVSVLGILSLLEGIGALVISFIPCVGVVGVLGGIVGLILGLIGWQLAKNSNGRVSTSLPIAGTATSGAAIAIAISWPLVFGGGFGGLFGKRAPNNDGPPAVLTATELATAYDDNADAADKLYLRRTVEVTGVIRRATIPGLDTLSVRLVGTWATDVDCRFDSRLLGPAGTDEVRALEEGQEITVRGRNRGDSLWVTVEDCMIVRAGPKPKPKDEPKNDPRPAPDPDPIPKPKPKPKPKEPPIPLTAEELQRAYDQNAIGADAKYKDKTLDLTGKVARVVRGGLNTATVELVGDRGTEIDCRFAGDLVPLAVLTPGDTVAIRGTCLGEDDGTVTLDDCTLLKKLAKPALGAPTVVPLDALRKAYDGNVLAADAKYKGKYLEVTGTALRVNPPRQEKIVLELGTEGRFALLCEFPASAKAALENVEAGATVTLRGVCRGGDDGLIVFEDCALVRAAKKQPKALELAPPPRAK